MCVYIEKKVIKKGELNHFLQILLEGLLNNFLRECSIYLSVFHFKLNQQRIKALLQFYKTVVFGFLKSHFPNKLYTYIYF